MNAPPNTDSVTLGRVERLLRTFPHLILWVEKVVADAEAQRWSQR